MWSERAANEGVICCTCISSGKDLVSMEEKLVVGNSEKLVKEMHMCHGDLDDETAFESVAVN